VKTLQTVTSKHNRVQATKPRMFDHFRTTLTEIIREKIEHFKEPGFHVHGFDFNPKRQGPKIQACPGCGQPGFLHKRLKWSHGFKMIETPVNYRMEGVEGWCKHSTRREHQLWGHYKQPEVFGTVYDEEELDNGQIIRVPRRISGKGRDEEIKEA
jgi:hypothetical protein